MPQSCSVLSPFVPEPLEELLSLLMNAPETDPEKPATSQLHFPLTEDNCLDKNLSQKSDWGKELKPLCDELFLPLDKEQVLFLSHLMDLSAVHGMLQYCLAVVTGTQDTTVKRLASSLEGPDQHSGIRNLAFILIPHLGCSTKNVLR